jgi:predicted DNA-binding transcriptional regulator
MIKSFYHIFYKHLTLFSCDEVIEMNDRAMGGIILVGSLLGIAIYFYLIFLSPWSILVVQASAFLAVAAVLVIVAWIGYTLAITPPPMPLDDNFESFSYNDNEPRKEESDESTLNKDQ